MITPATRNDLALLLAMMRDFYAHEGIAFEPERAARALAELLADNTLGQVLLLNQEEQVVGYLVLTFVYSLEFGGRCTLIDELYLTEAPRGQGSGRAALEFAREFCQRQGMVALQLEVETVNVRAQKLYEQFGFVRHDRYLMTKLIGSPEEGSAD